MIIAKSTYFYVEV